MTERVSGHEGQPRVFLNSLTRTYAEHNQDELVRLANLIPQVAYTADDILAEKKSDGRDLSSKWQYSYALSENGSIAGFIVGYLRAAEANAQYPTDSLYMSELAVDPVHRGKGYAKKLIGHYLEEALKKGVADFTLQTNAAEWNYPVQRLYEQFGFRADGTKVYANREDVIMRATADGIKQLLDENN